jgi:regulatory protein
MSAVADRLVQGLEIAHRHLERRERTEAQMRRHLQAKRLEPPIVDATIAALREAGQLDDARFARLFAQDKRELQGWANDRIRRTLVACGVDRETVDQTLAAEGSPSELDRAVDLLRQRFTRPLRDRRERERAFRVLVRKGYDSELAVDALSAYERMAQDMTLR